MLRWGALILAMGLSGCMGTGVNFASKEPAEALAPSVEKLDVEPDVAVGFAEDQVVIPERKGFLSRIMNASAPAATAKEVSVAANSGPLPFGQIAKVCGIANRKLGTKVETEGGFQLYDTNPEGSAPRTHYVMGFKDGCARKFTAGLAFLGEPVVHEKRRYRSKSEYSEVDTAYETVKARICKVEPGKTCGAKLPTLQKSTAFLSVYHYFTDKYSAGEVLLHRGRVQASEF